MPAWLVPAEDLVVAELSDQDAEYGPDVLFRGGRYTVTPAGDYALAERDEAARQSIEREAQVTPGEVASLPDYGMGLADLVMAPRTTSTIDDATSRVTRRLRANPRVTRVREVGVRRIDTADGKPGLAVEIRAEVGARDARIAFTLPGATTR